MFSDVLMVGVYHWNQHVTVSIIVQTAVMNRNAIVVSIVFLFRHRNYVTNYDPFQRRGLAVTAFSNVLITDA